MSPEWRALIDTKSWMLDRMSQENTEETLIVSWEVPEVLKNLPDQVQFMRSMLTLTKCDGGIKARVCEIYVRELYGIEGIQLVENIVCALNHPQGRHG